MVRNIFRLRTAAPHHADEQKVGWLELFYDLVYVATIIALGDKLSHDLTLEGLASFFVLFVPIWWMWTGMTFYVTRFALDDVGHRLLVFAQMFTVAVLAIHIHDGLGATSRGFALAYAASRAILVLMYLRAGQQRPDALGLTRRYASGFSLAALIWLFSAFTPEPLRYGLWAAGLVVDFGTPLLPSTRRLQAQVPPDTHHLPERFGLFTIIVLGEAFIKVITAASETEYALHLTNEVSGALALIIAASLWWMYFDNVKGSVVRRTYVAGQVWVYTHLPLLAAITAFGVAAKKVVLLEEGHALGEFERMLATGTVAAALMAIAVLDLTHVQSSRDLAHRHLAYTRLGGAALVLLIGLLGESFDPLLLLALVALTCAAQIVVDVYRGVTLSASARASS